MTRYRYEEGFENFLDGKRPVLRLQGMLAGDNVLTTLKQAYNLATETTLPVSFDFNSVAACVVPVDTAHPPTEEDRFTAGVMLFSMNDKLNRGEPVKPDNWLVGNCRVFMAPMSSHKYSLNLG